PPPPPAAILKVQNPRLAEVAHADDSTGDGHRRRGREPRLVELTEPGMDLTVGEVRAEIVGVRIDPPFPQRGEFPAPDHALLLVVRHPLIVSTITPL